MAIDRGRAQSQSSIRSLIDPSPTVGLQDMKSQPPPAVPSSTPPELLGRGRGIGESMLVTAAPVPSQKASVVEGRKQTNSSTTLRSEVESAGLATNAISIKGEPGIVRAVGSQIGSDSRLSMESITAIEAKPYLPSPSTQQPIVLRTDKVEQEQLRTSGTVERNHQLVVPTATRQISESTNPRIASAAENRGPAPVPVLKQLPQQVPQLVTVIQKEKSASPFTTQIVGGTEGRSGGNYDERSMMERETLKTQTDRQGLAGREAVFAISSLVSYRALAHPKDISESHGPHLQATPEHGFVRGLSLFNVVSTGWLQQDVVYSAVPLQKLVRAGSRIRFPG